MQIKPLNLCVFSACLITVTAAFSGCGGSDSGGASFGDGGLEAGVTTGGTTSMTGGSGGATAGSGGSVTTTGGTGGTTATGGMTSTGGTISTGGVSGTGGTSAMDAGSTGTEPRCASGQILCNSVCTDVANDDNHCGNCDTACSGGASCVSGACGGDASAGCPTGMVDCGGGDCRDLSNDPEFCGACVQAQCGDAQFCQDGICVCRPGLTDCDGQCVDTNSDPGNCGGCGNNCDMTCVGGNCLNESSCTTTVCHGSACVDTDNDPLNCGDCDNACAMDQVCIAGQCWDYEPTLACDSCDGCSACGGQTCCDLTGYGTSCVDTTEPCP